MRYVNEIIRRDYPFSVLMLLHLFLLLTFATALEEKKYAHTQIQLHIHVKEHQVASSISLRGLRSHLPLGSAPLRPPPCLLLLAQILLSVHCTLSTQTNSWPLHVVPSPCGGPTLPCHTDTICLPGTKWHHRSGQRWRRGSPSAPPAAGQGGLLRGKHYVSDWQRLAVGGNVWDRNMMSVAAVLFSPRSLVGDGL